MLEQERPAVVTLQCQCSFATIKGPYKISLCHWSYATVTPSCIFYPLLFRKCLERHISNIRKVGALCVSFSEDEGRLIHEIYFSSWIFKTASRSSDGEATNNRFISLLIARYVIRVPKEHVARILLPSWTKGKFYKNNASFIAQNVDEKKSLTRKQDIIVQAVILVYAFLVSIPTLYPGLYTTNRVFRDGRNSFTLNFRRD